MRTFSEVYGTLVIRFHFPHFILQLTCNIDRMHKWRPKKYSLVFVLIRLTSLVGTYKIQKKCSFRTRLVGLISTKTKERFFWLPFMHSLYSVLISMISRLSHENGLTLPYLLGDAFAFRCFCCFQYTADTCS